MHCQHPHVILAIKLYLLLVRGISNYFIAILKSEHVASGILIFCVTELTWSTSLLCVITAALVDK